MKRMLWLATFAAVTEFVTPVRAWNERGHELVAFILDPFVQQVANPPAAIAG